MILLRLSKKHVSLTASPLAAALTSSSVTSPETCGSNNFFKIADNLSPLAATETVPSDEDAYSIRKFLKH